MTAAAAQTSTIKTRIPARLDRLPWSRFHWRILLGLGTAWILDGLEVTIVGAVASRLTESGSGISMTAGDIGTAAAIYVVGSCTGALFFGQLTDRFGRKKLFLLTLGIYILATALTAASFSVWFFYAMRFFTGTGIGGEYAAINSAIDELIPARARGRIDLVINGSYWAGSAAGSGAALFFLDTDVFAKDLGWRLAFLLGVVLAIAVMGVRHSVPESPRWLFIHGREDEAERLVDEIERDVAERTGQQLEPATRELTVRQRTAIPFREIAHVAITQYPRRAVLCLALFVGQAFLYNAVTFNLGTLMTTYLGVASASVPIFTIVYAASNFTGPVVLGRLFDTVGRKPMISGTYLGSAAVAVLLAILFMQDGLLGPWTFIVIVMGVFFLASSGASAAYLTASEIFPMETRALAIAFFYAIGTAVGGISGPLLFGDLIESKDATLVSVAFLIGAGVMCLGGIAELFLGVDAEGAQLEDIAEPLTAAGGEPEPDRASPPDGVTAHRARAAEQRARAFEHEASALRAEDPETAERHRRRQAAAQERAQSLEQLAFADEALARCATDDDPDEPDRARAEMHLMWARMHEHRARAHELRADGDHDGAEDEDRHAAGCGERARAASHRADATDGPVAAAPGDADAERAAVGPEEALDAQIESIRRVLSERGPTERAELARLLGARYWGSGVFRGALRTAVLAGDVRRAGRGVFALPEGEDTDRSRRRGG